MRLVLTLFFLICLPYVIKAQNDITSIDKEAEINNHQLSKAALKKVKFKDNIALIKVNDSLLGAVNKKGSIVIPLIYKQIYKEGRFFVLKNFEDNYHFFVNDKKILSPEACDTFIIKQNTILYASDQLWGAYIITSKNIEEVKPIYKDIQVVNNSITASEYQKWRIKNSKKDYCCVSADTLYFVGQHLVFERNRLAGVLNADGVQITKAIYSDIDEQTIYNVKFRLGEIEGHTTGMTYDTANDFISSHTFYLEDFLIDSIELVADTLKNFSSFKQIGDKPLLVVGKDSLLGVFDVSKQQFITPVRHTSIYPELSENILLIYDTLKFSIVDFDGIVLTEPHQRFDTVYEFHEGRAKFLKNGKLGFIDRRGNVRVAPQYKTLRDFHNGAAAVFLNGKWGFIDNDEAILVQPLYDEVIDFQNNIAAVRKGKFWTFVKKDGSESSNIKYDSVRYSGNNYWLVYKDKKVGLVDIAGREKLGARYDSILVCNDWVAVKKFNKWGIVDMKENTIVPLEYDFIRCNKSVFILKEKSNGLKKELNYEK